MEVVVGAIENRSVDVLVYLFAILLPFYREDITTDRDLVAMLVALAFIIFIFWRLDLYYINLLFTICRRQVFKISSPQDGNPLTGREPLILITYRHYLEPDERLFAYRVSETVLWEPKPCN